eukprot:409041-Amphidinium_carterae.2
MLDRLASIPIDVLHHHDQHEATAASSSKPSTAWDTHTQHTHTHTCARVCARVNAWPLWSQDAGCDSQLFERAAGVTPPCVTLGGSELVFGALAANGEPDEIRIVHDGTKPKGNIRQRGQFPMLPDVRHAMCLMHERRSSVMGFKADVSQAHKRIKVRPSIGATGAHNLGRRFSSL